MPIDKKKKKKIINRTYEISDYENPLTQKSIEGTRTRKEQIEKSYSELDQKKQTVGKKAFPTVRINGETITGEDAILRAKQSAVSRAQVPAIPGANATTKRNPETGEIEQQVLNVPGENTLQTVGQSPLQSQAQQVGQLTPEQFAQLPQEQQQIIQNANPGIDIGQALGSGLSVAIPSAIGAATVGAVGGAAVGGLGAIPGAIGGAVLGAIGGFVGGVIGNLKSQAGGKIEAASQNVEKAETNLRALVQDTNMNPANAARNIQLFNFQLARLDSTHSQLRLETRSNLNKFLGKDGTPQLERFEIFNAPGGARQILESQMQTAVLNPNPNINLIRPEEIQNQNI